MPTKFNLTPHDRFGVEINPNHEYVNIQRDMELSINLNLLDTRQSLVDKLIEVGRIKHGTPASAFEIQRDDNIIQVYDTDAERKHRVLFVELVKDGFIPPNDMKDRPDRDGNHISFGDLGNR